MKNNKEVAFQNLLTKSLIAWPILCMFITGIILSPVIIVGAIKGLISPPLAVFINTLLGIFIFFPVIHEASHYSVSKLKWLNDTIGSICGLLYISPVYTFTQFRFVHLQHHKFTGEPLNDPDAWLRCGNKWTLVIRLFLWDIWQVYSFLVSWNKIAKKEKIIHSIEATINVLLIIIIVKFGYLVELLLYGLLPSGFGNFYIGFLLSYVPHRLLESDNSFKTTSNIIGSEKFLRLFLMFQNYHLAHHLYPGVPFYKDIQIWNTKEAYHLSNQPDLISISGKKINPDNLMKKS